MKLERERAKGSQRERKREREGSGEAVLAVTIRVLLVVPQGRTGYFCWVWGNEYRGIQRVQRRECVSSTNELSRELEMNVEKVVVVKRYCLASSSNPQYSLDCRTTTSSGKWIPASQPSYFYSFHSLPCSTMLYHALYQLFSALQSILTTLLSSVPCFEILDSLSPFTTTE